MTAVEPLHLAGTAQLDRDNPWPGLSSYDEGSFAYFSGRAAESDDLLRRIVDEPITVLFGKSGLGKTSLLRAGVFPRLRDRGLLPVLLRLQIRAESGALIDQVRQALATELRARDIDHPPLEPEQMLWEYLHAGGRELWTRQNRLVRPVFVFDQFEEVFTLGRSAPAEVERFREHLADLAENRIPRQLAERLGDRLASDLGLDVQAMPYKIVIALREDFLADLEGWRVTMPSLRRNRMRLLPMGPGQALQAVYNDRTKHLVDEPLARKIVTFLASGPDDGGMEASLEGAGPAIEPALLSLFCRGVNEHRKRDQKAQFDEALIEGATETIVSDFYRTSLADQPPRVRTFIEEELITEHGYRNSYSVDDAVGRGLVTARELETLINRHLLRHEHHLGTERVELTHDLLTRAVVEERDTRRLDERAKVERRQRLRLTAIAALSVLLALVFAALSLRATRAERQANLERDRSRSRELGALSATRLNEDPEVAMLLALRGLDRADTAETRTALIEAAQFTWPSALLEVEELRGKPDAIALSSDGSRLAVIAGGHAVTMWDVTVRQPRTVWPRPLDFDNSSAVAFSPDGKLLAVARRTSIELLRADSAEVFRTLPTPELDDRRIIFSPDGRWMVTDEESGWLRLIDVANDGQAPERIEAPGIIGFSVVSGDRILAVRDHPLTAVALSRSAGKWKIEELPLGACTRPQSVSPGVAFFSATWRAHACMFNAADGSEADSGTEDRATEDIIWSATGSAAVELLVARNGVSEMLIGQHPTGLVSPRIKGAHLSAIENERTRIIAVSESGGRVAILDEDSEHQRVRVYSLGNHKPFLADMHEDGFAVAPDGAWAVVVRPNRDDSAELEVVALDTLDPATLVRVAARAHLPAMTHKVYATRNAIVAVLRGSDNRTLVIDAATGAARFAAIRSETRPLGPTGDLILVPPTSERQSWDVRKTADGSRLDLPAPFATPSGNDTSMAVLPSREGNALAVVRVTHSRQTGEIWLYRVNGESLEQTGAIEGMKIEDLSGDFGPAEDGRSLVTGGEKFRWIPGAAGKPAVKQEVPEGTSPLSRFALQKDAARLVKTADGSLVRQFPFDVGGFRFSGDDRFLAAWSESELQLVDLSTGSLVFTLTYRQIQGVEFAAGNTILNVTRSVADFRGDAVTVAVPIDGRLLDRFGSWLAWRDLTADESSRFGVAVSRGGNRRTEYDLRR